MAFPPIVALIGVLALFVIIDTIGKKRGVPFLSDLFILVYFMFAFVNLEGQKGLATFYLIGGLIVLIFRATESKFALKTKTVTKIGSFKLAGALPLLSIALGVGIFLIMRLLQGTATGSIIGTPALSITSPAFNVTTIMLLGIVETRLFFTFFSIIKSVRGLFGGVPIVGQIISMVGIIFPVLLTSFLFAIFHLTAYAGAVSSVIFALIVMVLWIASFIITNDDLPANISHALWNGLISASTLGVLAL